MLLYGGDKIGFINTSCVTHSVIIIGVNVIGENLCDEFEAAGVIVKCVFLCDAAVSPLAYVI